MIPTGFCFALTEFPSMLQQPTELYRNTLDLSRNTLDLNQHVFDLEDIRLQAQRAATFLYHHAPPAVGFWQPEVRDYWSRGLPTWQDLFHNFAKQEQEAKSVETHVVAVQDQSKCARICSDGASICKNAFIKYVIESPSWLPDGWITEVQTRRTGTTAGTRDKYYKDPVSGRRFRSRNEVIRFLQTGKGRVRRRYKRKAILSQGPTTENCVMSELLSAFAGKPQIAETSLPCLMPFQPLAPTIFPIIPEECQPSSTNSKLSAPDAFEIWPPNGANANCKPAAAKLTPKKRPQDNSPKPSPKKKVRFEPPKKGVDRKDTILWQWLQKPVEREEEESKATRNGKEKEEESALQRISPAPLATLVKESTPKSTPTSTRESKAGLATRGESTTGDGLTTREESSIRAGSTTAAGVTTREESTKRAGSTTAAGLATRAGSTTAAGLTTRAGLATRAESTTSAGLTTRADSTTRARGLSMLPREVLVASGIDEQTAKVVLSSRQRARLVQKLKARHAKQLLAALGRQICLQLLHAVFQTRP